MVMKLLLYWMVVLVLVLIFRNEPVGLESDVSEKITRSQNMQIPIQEKNNLPMNFDEPINAENMVTYQSNGTTKLPFDSKFQK
jgi:hypothetical protein